MGGTGVRSPSSRLSECRRRLRRRRRDPTVTVVMVPLTIAGKQRTSNARGAPGAGCASRTGRLRATVSALWCLLVVLLVGLAVLPNGASPDAGLQDRGLRLALIDVASVQAEDTSPRILAVDADEAPGDPCHIAAAQAPDSRHGAGSRVPLFGSAPVGPATACLPERPPRSRA